MEKRSWKSSHKGYSIPDTMVDVKNVTEVSCGEGMRDMHNRVQHRKARSRVMHHKKDHS